MVSQFLLPKKSTLYLSSVRCNTDSCIELPEKTSSTRPTPFLPQDKSHSLPPSSPCSHLLRLCIINCSFPPFFFSLPRRLAHPSLSIKRPSPSQRGLPEQVAAGRLLLCSACRPAGGSTYLSAWARGHPGCTHSVLLCVCVCLAVTVGDAAGNGREQEGGSWGSAKRQRAAEDKDRAHFLFPLLQLSGINEQVGVETFIRRKRNQLSCLQPGCSPEWGLMKLLFNRRTEVEHKSSLEGHYAWPFNH